MWGDISLWFWFAFPCWCWASFHVSVGHLYVFFGKTYVQFLWPFFHWNFLAIELYELFIYFGYKTLINYDLQILFSHSIDYLFILLMVSFAVQESFSKFQASLWQRPQASIIGFPESIFITTYLSILLWLDTGIAATRIAWHKHPSTYVWPQWSYHHCVKKATDPGQQRTRVLFPHFTDNSSTCQTFQFFT